MSCNSYLQVALTYVRRPLGSWPGRLAIAGILVTFGESFFLTDREFFLLLPAMFLFSLVVIHVKDQFVDSRARLMPGFCRVHATVAGSMTMAVAVLLPGLLAWSAGLSPIGVCAVTALLFGLVLWEFLTQSVVLGLVLAGIWLATPFVEPLRGGLQQLLAGHAQPRAWGILAVGILATAWGMTRLARVNEDMPEYRRLREWNWDCTNRTSAGRLARGGESRVWPWFWDWLAERQMAKLTRHAARAPVSRWSRICRWQAGMPCDGRILYFVVIMVVGLQIMVWMLPQGSKGPMGVVMGLASVYAIMPAAVMVGGLVRRGGAPAHELMMPVDRRAYVRQMGVAFAWEYVLAWCVMSLAVVVWWIVNAWQPDRIAVIVDVLLFSLAGQILAFGILVWVSVMRNRVVGAFALGLLMFVSQIVLVRLQTPVRPVLGATVQGEVLWAAAIFVLFGAVLTWTGYRRWLTVDFD